MSRFIAVLPAFVRLIRLSWRLVTDSRVPMRLKALPALALLYVLSPVDLIPDIVPILGQADDVIVATSLLALFTNLAPAALTRAQRASSGRTGRDDRTVIDGRFHYIDED